MTDARTTMALYRLHKVEWEQQPRASTDAWREKTGSGKRKRPEEDLEGGGSPKRREEFPGGGRKGISSGLAVVVRRLGQKSGEGGEGQSGRRGPVGTAGGGKWWEEAAG